MGCWDELCVVSGIRPGGHPWALFSPSDLEELSSTIANEVHVLTETHLDLSQLTSIVTEALTTFLPREAGGLSQYDGDVWWVPEGLFDWEGFDTSVAIGYFNEMGECPIDTSGEMRKVDQNEAGEFWPIPNGVGVEVRRVRQGDSGSFDVVVIEDNNGKGGEWEEKRWSQCAAHVGIEGPNFFVLEGCYRYLEMWLDPSVPLSVPSQAAHGQSLPLAGEFYEIIHSRMHARRKSLVLTQHC
jgi:hypothetical protein